MENLKKYGVAFRVNSDSELIDFIESQKAAGKGTSEIFREAIEEFKNRGS